MAPGVSYTKTGLGWPVFTLEFDPYSRGYLVVGGGGGENKTGVPNKIVALDVSSPKQIDVAAEIELSRDEDSPQSLASLATKDGLITFAGVNSSSSAQKSGRNDHFRSFSFTYPTRGSEKKGNASQLGKGALFEHAAGTVNQSYQRLLRLTRVQRRDAANKRIGAIATGMAKTNEVVLFDATIQNPSQESVCARFKLRQDEEATDLDIWEHEPEKFSCVWCTDYDVYLYSFTWDFASKTSNPRSFEPAKIYSRTKPQSGSRTKLRGIRWISPQHLLVMVTRPNGEGVELLILRVGEPGGPAQVTLRKTLPKHVKSAVGLETTHLDPDPATKEQQVVIAVLSKDGTIPMYTLDYHPGSETDGDQMSKFSDYHTIPRMHPTDITRITLSNFFAPRQPATSTQSVASKTQYIQLASVALGGTVVVCSIPLTSTPTKPSQTTKVDDNNRRSPNVRYVLSDPKSEWFTSVTGRVLIAIFVLIFAITLKSVMSLQDGSISRVFQDMRAADPREHAANFQSSRHNAASSLSTASAQVSQSVESVISVASDAQETVTESVAEAVSSAQKATHSVIGKVQKHGIMDLLHLHHRSRNVPEKAEGDEEQDVLMEIPSHALHLILDPETSELAASTHHIDDIEHLTAKGAKRFEELTAAEQQVWKERLAEAGHWAENMPMTVLKGVLFSEYAGIVGGALRDALLNN